MLPNAGWYNSFTRRVQHAELNDVAMLRWNAVCMSGPLCSIYGKKNAKEEDMQSNLSNKCW